MGWRRRLASLIDPEIRSTSLGAWDAYAGFAAPSLSGTSVTTRTALGIAAVWNAVSIYANTVAGLDLYVARRDPRGGRRPAPDHPIYPLVSARPNPITSTFGFRQSLMFHALTRGNGYAEIERNTAGRPVELHLMDPLNVRPTIEPGGELVYHLVDKGIDLESRNVIHIHGLGWDGITGYSPITLFRETLGLAIGERDHTAGLMGNSATASGYLEIAGKLTETARNRLRGDWNAIHQGPGNAGNIGILEGGMKFVQTSFSPADTELLLSREFSIAEVARIFNLPQHMLGVLEHATFSNIEEMNLQFYQLSLTPWLQIIEQELNAKLFGPIEKNQYFCTHDAASILRGNTAAQVARVEKLFGMGMMSRNEGRMTFGLPPVQGGDVFYIPSNNLSPIGAQAGEEPTLDPDDVTVPPGSPDPSANNPEKLPLGAID